MTGTAIIGNDVLISNIGLLRTNQLFPDIKNRFLLSFFGALSGMGFFLLMFPEDVNRPLHDIGATLPAGFLWFQGVASCKIGIE